MLKNRSSISLDLFLLYVSLDSLLLGVVNFDLTTKTPRHKRAKEIVRNFGDFVSLWFLEFGNT